MTKSVFIDTYVNIFIIYLTYLRGYMYIYTKPDIST